MLVLSDRDVRDLALPVDATIEVVAEALNVHRPTAAGPTKLALHPSPDSLMHALPALDRELDVAGLKWISYVPANTARGLPATSGLLVVNDAQTAHPLCVMDAIWVTRARTGACAAVTARALAPPGAEVLTLIGVGPANLACLPYLLHVLPALREIRLVARRHDSAVRAAADLDLGIPVVAPRRAEDAVREADVVLSAIGRPEHPPLHAAWLQPGGLALPLEGEAAWESSLFHEADLLVADDVAVFHNAFGRHRPGEPLPTVHASLTELLAGDCRGRRSDDDRIVVSNNGIGILDIVLARRLYDRAVQVRV